jgi:glycosyltransferase involved in cell wall biosynthesis
MNARELSDGWDVVIVHDPQPAAMISLVPRRRARWVWRCHIDLSTPNPRRSRAAAAVRSALRRVVFHMRSTCPGRWTARQHLAAGDRPAAPKNMALSPEDAAYVCDQFGIDVDRPLMCQVSRFDPWKDPLGVIDAYRIVKEEMPEVQLALVGSMATDDPEGWDFFNSTIEYADGDPDINILNNLNNVGAIEVNAFQSQADVVIQKSTREGFGLTVSEALWKARPFIGGDVGGIPLQVQDGETGYLVDSPRSAPRRARDPARPGLGAARARGQGARAQALPHAAPAARLARATDGERSRAARRRRPRDGAAQPRLAPRRDVDRERDDDDEDRARARRRGARRDGARRLAVRLRLVAHDPQAYDWYYNVVANPMLWFSSTTCGSSRTRRTSTRPPHAWERATSR